MVDFIVDILNSIGSGVGDDIVADLLKTPAEYNAGPQNVPPAQGKTQSVSRWTRECAQKLFCFPCLLFRFC